MPDQALEPIIEVVITAGDEEWLVSFSRTMVEQGLAAAVHHTPIRSVYTWRGQLHDERETRTALHTRASLFKTIETVTLDHHPYVVACVIALPISDATPEYHRWIIDSTKDG